MVADNYAISLPNRPAIFENKITTTFKHKLENKKGYLHQ